VNRETLKCLSLTQPWATLVVTGVKLIETRRWRTDWRGILLAIHAAKAFPAQARLLCTQEPFCAALSAYCGVNDIAELPLGAVIGATRLDDCKPTKDLVGVVSKTERAFGDFTVGRFGWVLKDAMRLAEPIKVRGRLSLWDLPEYIEGQVLDQWERAHAS
jgi:hypothetical protein